MIASIGHRAVRGANLAVAWLGRRQHPVWQKLFVLVTGLQSSLVNSRFARDASVMLIGTVLGQMVSVILSPALTRIYSPEQFASLSIYMSFLNMIAVPAAMRYEIAVPAAKSAIEAVNLFCLCIGCLFVTTLLLSVAAICISSHTLASAGLKALDGFRPLVPVGFFLIGGYSVMIYYAMWAKDLATVSRTRISQGIAGPISQITLGLFRLGATGLAIGFVIGQSSGTLLLFRRLVLHRLGMFREASLRGVLRAAIRHRNFPLFSSWGGIVEAAGFGQIAYILVAAFYPGSLAGFMFLAERIVARPLQMVSTSMQTAYMADISQALSTDPLRVRRRFLQVVSRQFLFSLSWILTIDLVAYLGFGMLFGTAWGQAVPYVITLSVSYMINSVYASVGHTLAVLGRLALVTAWQVGRLVVICLCFVLSYRFHLNALHAIMVYTAAQVIACVFHLYLMKISIDRLIIRSTAYA